MLSKHSGGKPSKNGDGFSVSDQGLTDSYAVLLDNLGAPETVPFAQDQN